MRVDNNCTGHRGQRTIGTTCLLEKVFEWEGERSSAGPWNSQGRESFQTHQERPWRGCLAELTDCIFKFYFHLTEGAEAETIHGRTGQACTEALVGPGAVACGL